MGYWIVDSDHKIRAHSQIILNLNLKKKLSLLGKWLREAADQPLHGMHDISGGKEQSLKLMVIFNGMNYMKIALKSNSVCIRFNCFERMKTTNTVTC